MSFSMYKEDTIAAIATPLGEGGVGIVRLSGVDAERIASLVFVRKRSRSGKLRSHMLYHGAIWDPRGKRMVDEVLLTVMRKPHSYTGEDVVEIQCHGGAFIVREVLGVILAQGARQAEPGEFTKRAFLNGRIDLTQAEAVLDLVHARTQKAMDLALSQAKGELAQWVGELREKLLDILVQVEAAIDFPEEDLDLFQRQELTAQMTSLREKIDTIVESYEWGKLYKDGARVCICGRPNVGKSSLLNALLGEERVIVTPVPGTTRDVVEDSLNLKGLPLVLWDTAGLRETDDTIEQIGVRMSRAHIDKADAVIIVLDGSEAVTEEDVRLLREIDRKNTLVIINKKDLRQEVNATQLGGFLDSKTVLSVSARTGEGVNELKRKLRELLLTADVEPPVVLTNERHRSSLVCGARALTAAMVSLAERQPPEITAVCLQDVRERLEEIVGTVANDDILERIFAQFCIGK
jgi:tRNA modification GTPase